MAFLSFLFSTLHGLLLVFVPIFTFLWIIGKLKSMRARNNPATYQQQPFQYNPANPHPSPTNIHLTPRRLSFSSAAGTNTPNTPTSNANPKRRVTFSLTPEQQANELLKTAVRRREALPLANTLFQNHYQHQQPHVAHLFPSQNPVVPVQSSNHPPIPVEQPSNPPARNPSNPPPQPIQKPIPAPNNTYDPLPSRRRSPRKPLPRPTSPPPYAAHLVRPSRNRIPQTTINQNHDNELPRNSSPARRSDIRAFNPNRPTHTHRATSPSDNKPPKSPGMNNISNGFVAQQRPAFQQGLTFQGRENGFVQRSVL